MAGGGLKPKLVGMPIADVKGTADLGDRGPVHLDLARQ